MTVATPDREPDYEELKAGYIDLSRKLEAQQQISQNLADQIIGMTDKLAASRRQLMDHGYRHAVEVNGIADAQPSPWASVQHVDVEAVTKEIAEEQELFARLADEMSEGK